MWQSFSGRVYLQCIPCFNCLCSVLTMSLVHTKILLVNFWNPKWPIDLKWPEMRSKLNFGHPKRPKAAILSKIFVSIWNGQKCEWFEQCSNRLLADYNLVSIYIYIQTSMLGTREYTLCSPFRANAHNSSLLTFSHIPPYFHAKPPDFPRLFEPRDNAPWWIQYVYRRYLYINITVEQSLLYHCKSWWQHYIVQIVGSINYKDIPLKLFMKMC